MFSCAAFGHLEHLYYGARINTGGDFRNAAQMHVKYPAGNLISYSKEEKELNLENVCQEISTHSKGDIHDAFLKLHILMETLLLILFMKVTGYINMTEMMIIHAAMMLK